MEQVVTYFQLGANGFALAIAGWIYLAYIKNLRSTLEAKDEQLRILEKNVALWKDRAHDFEKKTPAYVEEMLAKRIKHREEEIKRLDEDREENLKLLKSRTREVARLRAELEKTTYLSRVLTYYDVDTRENVVVPESEIELEHLGEIDVDSASILITDPVYADALWRHDVEYEDIRIHRHVDTGKIYQYGVDFERYDSVIEELGKSPNELMAEGKLIPLEINRELTFSLPGALYAASSKHGYGELELEDGRAGAGICVRTVHGDGVYQVYGERYRDSLFRIYIELYEG